ncbi:MAG: DNA polymerase III subunit delta' [Acidobacteria bacterium]|nr:DNA polymerase III subunit delta' [Acidobacteriota bacterium]MCB9396728.1 DNA polymerase III subunit delta' [Acidobacteriota bacterium]
MYDKVFGHSRIKNILGRMVRNQRLPNTLCFSGPFGIGKRLMAAQTARILLCATQTGCGTCSHCHKFDQQIHPDYLEVAPEGREIKVDQIRSIVEGIHFRPYEAKHRVLVIDSADRMGDSAANAFLKTLEEPPSYVTFILVTAHWDQLLPTIRSRSQRIQFQPLSHLDKVNILRSAFQLDDEWAERLAGISFTNLETSEEAWKAFEEHMQIGLSFFGTMMKDRQAIEMMSPLLRDRNKAQSFLLHLTELVRAILMRSHGMPLAKMYEPFRDPIEKLAQHVPAPFWREALAQLLDLEFKKVFNPNLGLFFDQFSVNQLGLLEEAQLALEQRIK